MAQQEVQPLEFSKGEEHLGHSIIAQALLESGNLRSEQLHRAQRIRKLLEEPKNLFEILVELGEISEEAIAEVVAQHGTALRIGEILLEQGLIDQDALERALQLQIDRGLMGETRLGDILVELGEINEQLLLQNVANQHGLPYMEPSFALTERSLLDTASPDYLEQHLFVPFSKSEDGKVVVVLNDLGNKAALEAIDLLFHQDARLAVGPKDAIRTTIEDFRRYKDSSITQGPVRAESEEDSVIQQVNHLIGDAIEERASDIHIEPMAESTRLRYRIDGVLVYKTDLPIELHRKLVSRIKIMAEADIAEHQAHQGGRILFPWHGVDYDLRLSIYVTVHGECLVMRILSKQMGLVSLNKLGMDPPLMKSFRRQVLDIPTGVVIITAPTGEGKTTTLYSCLDQINDMSLKIITAEDPVEYRLDGIIQCAIYPKAGRTFETTLREIVRQDPDIVVLGEIRDTTTAKFAVQAALTGHKVYCTFHTEDSVAALIRLMNMQVETYLIASTVLSILAQRLLRRICTDCAVPHVPTLDELQALDVDPAEIRQFEIKRGKGCTECNYTGYRGRVAVFESLVMNDAIRDAIAQRQPASAIREITYATTDILSMREDALAKALTGITSLDEVRRQTPVPHRMRSIAQIQRMTR